MSTTKAIVPSATATTATKPIRRPPVGREIRRWRLDRGRTLAELAARSGLNVGYLSQIENDKASPSLDSLAAIGAALDVPPAWFLMSEAPAPRVVRATDRPIETGPGGSRLELVDGRLSRGFAIRLARAAPGSGTGSHSHAGEEHQLVLAGRWRLTQGDHEVEVGPGDYVLWDGTVPHDAQVIGPEDGEILVIGLRRDR
jgi:transcriptional regulator with XRE-family HTH domain